MSAPTRDPLTVQTQDGSSWRRRAQDTAGHGLYARSDSTEACPTLRTIRELAEFGLKGMSAPQAEGEHYAIVHHAYTTGRDLPGSDGAR